MNLTVRPVTVHVYARTAPDRPAGYAYVRPTKIKRNDHENRHLSLHCPGQFPQGLGGIFTQIDRPFGINACLDGQLHLRGLFSIMKGVRRSV